MKINSGGSRRTHAAALMNTAVSLMNATAPEMKAPQKREKVAHPWVSKGGEFESEIHFSKISPSPNPLRPKKLNFASHLSLAKTTALLANVSQLKFLQISDFKEALNAKGL